MITGKGGGGDARRGSEALELPLGTMSGIGGGGGIAYGTGGGGGTAYGKLSRGGEGTRRCDTRSIRVGEGTCFVEARLLERVRTGRKPRSRSSGLSCRVASLSEW